jgi:Flp pilus assembly protein CpaB
VALRVEQATLERRSSSASDGGASVAVALLGEQATLELSSDGVASVVVALRVEQATLELRSTSASDGGAWNRFKTGWCFLQIEKKHVRKKHLFFTCVL